jgi:hypothetical protein
MLLDASCAAAMVRPELNEDFIDVLAAFAEHGVEFVVVGAHALAAHGIVRAERRGDGRAARLYGAARDECAPRPFARVAHHDGRHGSRHSVAALHHSNLWPAGRDRGAAHLRNSSPRRIEGRFRFVLPPRASLSHLAMKIDGQWREADAAELSAARETYEAIVQRRRDPLLVEQWRERDITSLGFASMGSEASLEPDARWPEGEAQAGRYEAGLRLGGADEVPMTVRGIPTRTLAMAPTRARSSCR